MTAGDMADALDLVIVPARLKPMLGICTLSSPGIENADVRDAADAMSSRAISIICVGMFNRSRPPSASAHRLTARSPAGGGLLNVNPYLVALMTPFGVSMRSGAADMTRIVISACGAIYPRRS